MNNLARFLQAIAEGVSEVAEQIDAEHEERGGCSKSNALRDYFSQLNSVADRVRPDGTVEWAALAEGSIGIDVQIEPLGGRVPAVYAVAAPEREDGLYLFGEHGQAAAFAEAATDPDSPFDVGVDDPPLNVGQGAENLIAIERGARLEDAGCPLIADQVREGMPLTSVLATFAESAHGESDETGKAKAMLGRWIELDRERGAPADLQRVSADSVEPGHWIALDDDGRVCSGFRQVADTHISGLRVHLAFRDGEPGASFNSDARLWRRSA